MRSNVCDQCGKYIFNDCVSREFLINVWGRCQVIGGDQCMGCITPTVSFHSRKGRNLLDQSGPPCLLAVHDISTQRAFMFSGRRRLRGPVWPGEGSAASSLAGGLQRITTEPRSQPHSAANNRRRQGQTRLSRRPDVAYGSEWPSGAWKNWAEDKTLIL